MILDICDKLHYNLVCDKCGEKFIGRIYFYNKKNVHLCKKCSLSAGWEKKYKECPFLPDENILQYIVKRINNKNIFTDHYTGSKKDKLVVRCPGCKKEYQTNEYDFIKRKNHKCASCNNIWNNAEWKKNEVNKRNNNGHYDKIQSSLRKSEKYWKSREVMGKKRTEKNAILRGCKIEDRDNPWYIYRRLVYKQSEVSYRRNKNKVNPENLQRGRSYHHLDHIYSVFDGFTNNIPIYIISHYKNLQLLDSKNNIAKNHYSSITKDQLFERVFNDNCAQ